jgi:LacI family transcriptional regulator
MNVNINFIAKKAKVSRTTVSRVLNNKPDVSNKTREKVLRVIKEYDFYPSVFAKGIITKKNYNIGLIIPYDESSIFTNPFFSEVIHGVSKVARNKGYYLLYCNEMNNDDYISLHKEKRVEGFIILSPNAKNDELFEKLEHHDIPYVATAKIPGSGYTHYVDVDNRLGAALAVDHLVSLGHRKIAFVTGPDYLVSHEDRLKGYKAALEKHGLTFNSDYVIMGDNSIESGYSAAQRLLQFDDRPTAIFASADMMAIGVMKAIKNEQYHIPKDFSVIGFDDILLVEYVEPPLTTIRQPASQKGMEACSMLIDLLENDVPINKRILPVELVIRASTGIAP